MNGLAGNDTLTVDSSLGGLNLTGQIHFDGGADADTLVVKGGKVVSKTTSTGPANAGTIRASEVVPDARTLVSSSRQLVAYEAVETVKDTLPEASTTEKIGYALQSFFRWLGAGTNAGGGDKEFALLGGALPRAISGDFSGGAELAGDPVVANPGAELEGAAMDSGESEVEGLQRIIESGPHGFSLSDIGSVILTTADLKARLDALDDIPNNVTLTETGGVTRFDVHVVTRLDGSAGVNVNKSLPFGSVDLAGSLELSAEVDLNIAFGLDASGFFLDTGNAGPALTIKKIDVDGGGSASGQFGFLDVGATLDKVTIADAVGLTVSLKAPAADGLLRLDDFAAWRRHRPQGVDHGLRARSRP